MSTIGLSVKVTGLDEVIGDMERLRQNVQNLPDHVAEMLSEEMTQVVHVVTGYLRSTIYERKNIAGATAFYAGMEADRGGEHDFPGRAIEALDEDKILEWLMEGVQ